MAAFNPLGGSISALPLLMAGLYTLAAPKASASAALPTATPLPALPPVQAETVAETPTQQADPPTETGAETETATTPATPPDAGRLGLILTSLRGVLDPKPANLQRKTLLGE